ncbi:MAG: hypothetical protein SFU56_18730 [Capsulimonadales bacterium]|nr:hypothetical protein [Capsulimonadales bacterium]
MNGFAKLMGMGLVLGLMVAGTPQMAHAQNTVFAIAGDTTPNPNVGYTGGPAGVFTLNVPKGFIMSKLGLGGSTNCRIDFTPLAGVGAAGYQFNPVTGVWSQILKGGAFRIVDNVTGKLLLSGQFGEAVLHGTNGSSSLALTLQGNTVNYGVAALFPTILKRERGSFAIEFNAMDLVKATHAGAGAFRANDGMSFAAWK